jgi:Ca-activated chloride channel family protein
MAPGGTSALNTRILAVDLVCLVAAMLLGGVVLVFPGIVPRGRAVLAKPQISVQVNVVSVPVTVTNRRGEFVRGLERQNFRLRVDGAEQPIKYFAAEEEPAQALVLVETGPAVYLLRHEHILTATELLGGLGSDDRVAIASYSDALRSLLNFTSNKQQVTAALGALNFGLGMADLNFYDSLGAAVDWSAEGNGKQSIVLLTTGLDSSGPGHWERLQEKLQQSNVMVLAVALGGELRDTGKGAGKDGKKRGDSKTAASGGTSGGISFAASDFALMNIAAETGGYAFFPRTDRDFQETYRRIGALLRHEYSLGFAADARDARHHDIQVELVDNSGRPFDGKGGRQEYRVNSRRGFLAPAP